MITIRWLSFENNPLTNPNCQNCSVEEALRFEKSPHREVSVELLNPKEGSYNQRRRVGLVVDMENTIFRRGYSEDGYTEIQADGITLRSPFYDEEVCERGVDIAFDWAEAEQMVSCLDPDRESWAEGVVWQPHYSAIAVRKGVKISQELLELMQKIFGSLRVIRVRNAHNTD